MPDLLNDASIRGDIKRETFAAAAVAVVVALLEFSVNELFHLADHPVWFVGLLIGAALLLFAIMMQGVGMLARRELLKEMQKPIPLSSVGIVNGLWVDAIWEEGSPEPFQVSIIQVRSSRAEGFAISGDSYECHYDQNLGKVDAFAGHFRGTGPPLKDANVHIAYTGGEHGDLDWGAITYRFRLKVGFQEEDPEAERYFDGDFLVRRSHPNRRRYVLGKKVANGELGNFRLHQEEFLEEFLSSKLVREYRRNTGAAPNTR